MVVCLNPSEDSSKKPNFVCSSISPSRRGWLMRLFRLAVQHLWIRARKDKCNFIRKQMSKSKGHRGWLRQTFSTTKNLALMKLSGRLVYTRINHHYTHNTEPKSALIIPKMHMSSAVHTFRKVSDILIVLLSKPIKPATESRLLLFTLLFIGRGAFGNVKSKDELSMLQQRSRKPDNRRSVVWADAFI